MSCDPLPEFATCSPKCPECNGQGFNEIHRLDSESRSSSNPRMVYRKYQIFMAECYPCRGSGRQDGFPVGLVVRLVEPRQCQ